MQPSQVNLDLGRARKLPSNLICISCLSALKFDRTNRLYFNPTGSTSLYLPSSFTFTPPPLLVATLGRQIDATTMLSENILSAINLLTFWPTKVKGTNCYLFCVAKFRGQVQGVAGGSRVKRHGEGSQASKFPKLISSSSERVSEERTWHCQRHVLNESNAHTRTRAGTVHQSR